MNEEELRQQIAKEIEEAMVHVPSEWAEQTSSGIPYAYVQGILSGRKQAASIVRGLK